MKEAHRESSSRAKARRTDPRLMSQEAFDRLIEYADKHGTHIRDVKDKEYLTKEYPASFDSRN